MKKLLKKEIKNIKSQIKLQQKNPHTNPLNNSDLWDLLIYRKQQLSDFKSAKSKKK